MSQRTQPSRLSDLARHLVIPSDITTTAWPSVRERCAKFGVTFDPWQSDLGSVITGKRPDGKWAATVSGIVLSIPRQVAKTFFVSRALVALATLHPNMKILWTAQHGRTITNTFRSVAGFVQGPKVMGFLAPNGVRQANGEQEIKFANGSVILFGAREHGFGRGFDEVDVIVFDEAQHLTDRALEDMTPAVNQARHPSGGLLFFMGTPPRPVDNGEVFTAKRNEALSGTSEGLVYVEASADPDGDPDDREQWRKANWSYPVRTPLESMLRMRKNLPSDAAWAREALGIWDSVGVRYVIPPSAWEDTGDVMSLPVDDFAIGVEVGPDMAWASVALAGRRDDGRWHVELDERQDGSAWLAPYVARLVSMNPQVRAVVVDVGGPVAGVIDDFARLRVEVTPLRVRELGAACSRFLDAVVSDTLRHTNQVQLTQAALAAGKRELPASGMWVWSRRGESDVTPIQAATYALWGAQNSIVMKPKRRSGSGKVVVL